MFWSRKSSAPVNALEEKSSSVSQLVSPSDDFLALFGITPSASGAIVSPTSAMRVPAVAVAVKAISNALGQIEAHVYTVGDKADKATDHPAYALLHDSVNPWTSASGFREMLTRDALLYGNGFAWIARDEDGNPVELNRMRPESVSVLVNVDTLEPSYRWTPLNSTERTFSYADVIHLRAASCDGILGESPVMQGREAIGLAITLEGYASRLFGNGARPSGVLEHPKTIGAIAAARLRSQIDASHGGRASGNTVMLEEGMKFNQTALTSVDAQFLEMRQEQIKEIAKIFSINPILLGEMVHASFANSAEMGRQFIQYTLSPWVIRWQGEVALKLLAPDERANYRIELDTDGFDRADIAARATAYSSMIAATVMSPNECRELESLPPYAGGERYFNPNTTPNETVTEDVHVG